MDRVEEKGNVTADDVAALAGVSRWTVNRAFKKDASISEQSRAKVMAAAQQLGYAPDLLAASLASDRSQLVALLIDDFSNPHKLVMLERLTKGLQTRGWDSLLVNIRDDHDTSHALMNAGQRRVDAAVLIGSNFNDRDIETALNARRVKKLIVFARFSPKADTISICCDDVLAMVEIANHVNDFGYHRPMFVAGPQTISAQLQREETFLTRWHDLKGKPAMSMSTDTYDSDRARAALDAHLGKLPRAEWPDILVCENDSIAMGAIDALKHTFGLSVPKDIAVTGFDDVPQAANPNYALTTYRQPLSDMVAGLAQILAGETPTRDLSRYPGQLIVRKSA